MVLLNLAGFLKENKEKKKREEERRKKAKKEGKPKKRQKKARKIKLRNEKKKRKKRFSGYLDFARDRVEWEIRPWTLMDRVTTYETHGKESINSWATWGSDSQTTS